MKQFGIVFLTVLLLESILNYIIGSSDFPLFSTTWFTWVIIISLIVSIAIWVYFIIIRKMIKSIYFIESTLFTIIFTVVIIGLWSIAGNQFKIPYPYDFILSILFTFPILLVIGRIKTKL